MRTESIDVLVIGAGPSGLIASALLARAGVGVLAIAKHPGVAADPRSTLTNQRTVEVLRDLDLEGEFAKVAFPMRLQNNRVYATTLTGQEVMRFHAYGSGERAVDYALASPCETWNAPQNLIEPVYLMGARANGADVRFAHEMLSIEQTDDAVTATILDRKSGEHYRVEAQYAIGADGARSRVAEQLKIPFTGETALKHMFNVLLDVDLEEHTAYRPALIYSLLQPGHGSWAGAGALVAAEPWTRWQMTTEYDPRLGEPDTSDDAVVARARALIGDPEIPVKVITVSKWQVNRLVAEQYRFGRVFLAGDAAHRHPPTGGRGSNTSIQDSFNLAWKLAFVLEGQAGERLLDSYHEERHPVGTHMVAQAFENLDRMLAINDALGLKQGQSAEEGWESLRHLASDEKGAAERRERLAEVIALQEYQSSGHGTDLGHRYTSGAVIDDGTPFPEPTRHPELYYHPTTHPGGYLPHCWLEHHRTPISTLDLAGHGRFSLIVGVGGQPWVEAATAVEDQFGIDLPVFSVGYCCEYNDVLGRWAKLREIDDRGALLVRPDRHIAWRAMTRSESPREALVEAVRHVLGRD